MDDHEDAHHDQADEQRENDREAPTPRVLDRLDRLARRFETTEAQRLFLGLDFDGTLAPHVDDPSAAEPTAENQRALEALCRRDGIEVAVISGRALDDVRTRVGIAGIDYAGNHGLELDGGSPLTDPDATRSAIRAACERLETELEGTGCEIENKRITATVHYRSVEEDIESRVRSIVETVVPAVERDGADGGLRCTPGRNIVEIRPAIDWDKGDAVRWFARRCSGACLSVYVGDDTTDEDAFRAIAPDGIGVHVGNDETAATYRVAGVEEVTTLLGWLADTGLDRLVEDTDGDRRT